MNFFRGLKSQISNHANRVELLGRQFFAFIRIYFTIGSIQFRND